ncbi:uncharacterized protein LOC107785729 [Nicotiana tabacum]|uniref:Uncharacterized protein LOC107785729 n=2 Tax=Nicotiana TaxID=4085 RepID=A0A1S3ZE72_TOBAC|nr:PREDICTED: uncharacterized protein LOC104238348 [Nicotiana sylvestris]XP_016462586.1 PREDICTED: uncharacterized protein LOC107785729 [Nicotiana tabacum]
MDVEQLLNLFNSYWFESEILKPKQPFSAISNLEQPKLSKTPTFIVRSQSDQCLSSKDTTFHSENSPKSVLVEPKLEPILSGKEYNELQFSSKPAEGGDKSKESYRRRKKKSNNSSKSLSELEFEELKGFMDLGFEFSDKDKDSSLVSILPGLRRLGRENEENMRFEELEEAAVSRPHLSEAWAVWEEKKKISWKINPVLRNEMEIKDQLRFWAHTVASTVRY